VEQLPDTTLLPVAQSPPATYSRATAHLLRQHLPRNPTAQEGLRPRVTYDDIETLRVMSHVYQFMDELAKHGFKATLTIYCLLARMMAVSVCHVP
jgi:hypothetical protein